MIQKFTSINKIISLLKKIFLFSVFIAISSSGFAQNNIEQKNKKSENKIGNYSYVENISNTVIKKEISLPQDIFKLKKDWWIDLLFILGFSIFSFFILKYQEEISLISNAFINKSLYKEVLNTKNSVYNNLYLFFNFSTYILLALFIFTFFKNVHSPFKTASQFIQIVVILVSVIFFYSILFFSSFVWSFLFKKEKIYQLYISNIRVGSIILFVFLLFSLFIIHFNSQCSLNCYKIFFFILLTIYSIRTFNLFRDFFEYGFSLFYLILYLCTVEIFPGLIIYKVTEELRYTVPPTLKYYCNNESIAQYLSKYVTYRKRKISFADGTIDDFVSIISKSTEEVILLPVADNHRNTLYNKLKRRKLNIHKAVFYNTVNSDLSKLNLDYDIIVLFSPAGVKSLVENFPGY